MLGPGDRSEGGAAAPRAVAEGELQTVGEGGQGGAEGQVCRQCQTQEIQVGGAGRGRGNSRGYHVEGKEGLLASERDTFRGCTSLRDVCLP